MGTYFLLGKIGFNVTITLFYSFLIFLNYEKYNYLKKIQIYIVLLICSITYFSLHFMINIIDNYKIFEMISFYEKSSNNFWLRILLVNFVQSIIYFLILTSNEENKIYLIF